MTTAMLAAGAALGLALGWAFFGALRLNARLYLAASGSITLAVLLHVGRMAAVAAALYAVVQLGALALIGATAGLTAASAIAQVRAARHR